MGEDDRRKYSRKKKQSIISFHVIDDSNEELQEEGEVVDGSVGGVRFRSKKSLSKNTRIYIKLDSGDWGEELTYVCKKDDMGLVEIIGSVMWCLENEDRPGEFEVGTRFIDMVEQ